MVALFMDIMSSIKNHYNVFVFAMQTKTMTTTPTRSETSQSSWQNNTSFSRHWHKYNNYQQESKVHFIFLLKICKQKIKFFCFSNF